MDSGSPISRKFLSWSTNVGGYCEVFVVNSTAELSRTLALTNKA